MKHKKQHWIPQAYLKAWCDPNAVESHDPYVWRFSKDGRVCRKKAPKNIFYEKEFYTVHLADGVRDLTIEHGLAGLEDAFVTLRDQRLAKRTDLSAEEELLLRAFMAATKSRTLGHLQHFQEQFKSALEMGELMRQEMLAKSPEERMSFAPSLGPVDSESSMSLDEVRELAEGPVGPMVVAEVKTQLPILAQMHLAVLCTDEPLGFITSDMPCVWFDPEAYNRPFPMNATGLAWPTIEITMPVSPRQAILLSWRQLDGYIDITPEQVDDLNRKTRFMCDAHFIVCRNEQREVWFDPGAPPDKT